MRVMIDGIQSSQSIQSIGTVMNAEKSAEIAGNQSAESSRKNIDEYVPSEKVESIGLYSVSTDKEGNSEVEFDAPQVGESSETTVNTDSVDREIKSLKDEQSALQRRLKTANLDDAADLQRQLNEISSELALKNNDVYRKANSVVS